MTAFQRKNAVRDNKMPHQRLCVLIACFVLSNMIFLGSAAAQILQSASVANTGLQPSSLAVHSNMNSLIVTNFGGDAIQSFPIDRECQLGLPRSWPTGKGPLSLALDPSSDLVHIAYFTDNRLGMFSHKDGELVQVGEYPTGRGPVDIATTPDGNRVFVSNVFDGTVSVFERTNNARLLPQEVISTVSNPRSMAVDSSGTFLFIADEQDPAIATLKIDIDGSIESVSRYVMQGPAEDLLAHPSLPILYVTQGQDNRILRLEVGLQGQLRQSASTSFEGFQERHDELGGLGLTGPFPGALSLDAENQRLFVTGRQTADIHVYDVPTGKPFENLGSFPVYEYPEGVALDSESNCLYVISSAFGQILGMKVF